MTVDWARGGPDLLVALDLDAGQHRLQIEDQLRAAIRLTVAQGCGSFQPDVVDEGEQRRCSAVLRRPDIAWVGLVHRALAVVKPDSMKDRLPSFATVPIANL